MAALILPLLGAFLVGLAVLATWDLISKRSKSVVWDYLLVLVALPNQGARALLFILMRLQHIATTPWRLTRRAINRPLQKRIDELEQRLDSQESILRSRQVNPALHRPDDESQQRQPPATRETQK